MIRRFAPLAWAVGLTAAALAGCATPLPTLPPPPVHPNGQVLWGLVHGRCVPDELEHHDPAPCALVSLPPGGHGGFAVLKDKRGVAQHLVMPTDKITGIEDAALLAPGAANYFADAWTVRRIIDQRLGGAVPRDQLSIAVNSIYGRTQDLLHLHLDCIAFPVRDALKAQSGRIGPTWSGPIDVDGQRYWARKLEDPDLTSVNPFQLLARTMPGARQNMGAWTLVAAPTTFPDGRAGFYLLAQRADPAHGVRGSGEDLQDHDCKGQAAYLAAEGHAAR